MNRLNFFLLPERILKRFSHLFLGISEKIEGSFNSLELDLKQSEIRINKIDYISYSLASSFILFILLFLLFAGLFEYFGHKNYIFLSVLSSFFLIFLNFLRILNYPRFITNRRVKNIEKDLLIVLRNMYVQVKSNIPLFTVMVNVAGQDFGEVSKEFKRMVKQINSGISEVKALEESATNTPSAFFRTVLWQIINGVKTGADISVVLKDLIEMLSGEQVDQIQEYGASLNSLALFYMLLVIIMPSLAITFLIASSVFFSKAIVTTKALFWLLYVLVVLFQIIFLGIIKSKRPSLLRDENV